MGDDIQIITNANEVGLRIKLFAQEVDRETRNLCDEIAENALENLQRFAPQGRTGELKDSFVKSPVRKRGNEYIARVVSTSPYARDVDQGTGRYGPTGKDILAPAGNAFRIIKDPEPGRHNKKEPGVVFTRSIRGQKPQYFISKAEAATTAFMVPAIEGTLGRAFRE